MRLRSAFGFVCDIHKFASAFDLGIERHVPLDLSCRLEGAALNAVRGPDRSCRIGKDPGAIGDEHGGCDLTRIASTAVPLRIHSVREAMQGRDPRCRQ